MMSWLKYNSYSYVLHFTWSPIYPRSIQRQAISSDTILATNIHNIMYEWSLSFVSEWCTGLLSLLEMDYFWHYYVSFVGSSDDNRVRQMTIWYPCPLIIFYCDRYNIIFYFNMYIILYNSYFCNKSCQSAYPTIGSCETYNLTITWYLL